MKSIFSHISKLARVMNFLKRTTHFIERNRIIFGSAAALAIVLAILPETAFAAVAGAEKTVQDTVARFNAFFAIMLEWMIAILMPLLNIMGGLLDNELIFGGLMGDTLENIWVQIRNIVNIIFVLLLLVIAFSNVLGFGEEGEFQKLSIKATLPKFIIALIVINFSFLGAKVVLDAANVLTTAAFALPSTVNQETWTKQRDLIEQKICKQPIEGLSKEDIVKLRGFYCNGNVLSEAINEMFNKSNVSSVPIAMAINMGKLLEMQHVKDGLGSLKSLTFNIIFSLLMYFIYTLSFAALFVVLIVRIVVLWVIIALSPLIGFTIVMPEMLQNIGGDSKPGDAFVQHAIAPVIIGVTFSVGFLMLDAFAPGTGSTLLNAQLGSLDSNTLISGFNDLRELLIAVAVAVLVWQGVFTAANKTMAKGITEKIQSFGETVGTYVAQAPLYIQAIPVGSFGPQSLMSIFRTPKANIEQLRTDNSKPMDFIGGAGEKHEIENTNESNIAPTMGKYMKEGRFMDNFPAWKDRTKKDDIAKTHPDFSKAMQQTTPDAALRELHRIQNSDSMARDVISQAGGIGMGVDDFVRHAGGTKPAKKAGTEGNAAVQKAESATAAVSIMVDTANASKNDTELLRVYSGDRTKANVGRDAAQKLGPKTVAALQTAYKDEFVWDAKGDKFQRPDKVNKKLTDAEDLLQLLQTANGPGLGDSGTLKTLNKTVIDAMLDSLDQTQKNALSGNTEAMTALRTTSADLNKLNSPAGAASSAVEP